MFTRSQKVSECAFVRNLFVDIANVVCMGQNACAAVTLTNHVLMFCSKKIYVISGVQLKMNYHGKNIKFWASETG